ncbi:MAG: hypothetical protein IJE97_15960 [Thermoguttaceae bacterium]|nr:hypothetical protein [Thermoguttaceae bacterium]MBQ7110141.1 hypothetical protein [Thermoguttaceae bacterium]
MLRVSPSKARRTAAFAFAVAAFFGAIFEAIGAVANAAEPTNVPSWARRTAENGVWQVDDVASPMFPSLVSLNDLRSDAAPTVGVFDGSFSGALGNSFVLRGQVPPVVSPSTTATQIGESTVYGSTSTFVLPPVTGDDPAFAPIAPTLDEEATTIQKVFKYRDDISASYMFVPKGDSNGLGMHEVEGRILFAFPWDTMRERTCFNNGFFLLTPSFRYNNWSQTDAPATAFKMPDSTFDAGLTTLFATNLRDLEVKVEVSVGVASSFQKIDCDAFYIRGRAMGALPIDNAKQVKATGGLIYYDRIEYKIVPSGGIIWRPNEQNVVRLVYPDPRWSRYLTKLNETDWWFYIGGEIGGGRWLIEDRGQTFNTDYDDYRVGLGLTFDCDKLKGCVEVGGAFNRKLVSKQGVWYEPKDAVYLKTGFLF